jgi:hypothetical protein
MEYVADTLERPRSKLFSMRITANQSPIYRPASKLVIGSTPLGAPKHPQSSKDTAIAKYLKPIVFAATLIA